MGLDYHGLCFLKKAFKDGPFGKTATIGRQNVHVDAGTIERVTGNSGKAYRFGDFCERLLQDEFAAKEVHSFDASDYEKATFIHDFNKRLEHSELYDTVIDLGTSEHIFDIAEALRNISRLCAVGGRILHVLPADNFNGHGFWQFSPELFFSLYSEKNGYKGTEVYIAEVRNSTIWYKVTPPRGGKRVEFASRSSTYVLVATRKNKEVTDPSVQQSDYVVDWSEGNSKASRPQGKKNAVRSAVVSAVDRAPALSRFARSALFNVRSVLSDFRRANAPSRDPAAFTKIAIGSAIR